MFSYRKIIHTHTHTILFPERKHFIHSQYCFQGCHVVHFCNIVFFCLCAMDEKLVWELFKINHLREFLATTLPCCCKIQSRVYVLSIAETQVCLPLAHGLIVTGREGCGMTLCFNSSSVWARKCLCSLGQGGIALKSATFYTESTYDQLRTDRRSKGTCIVTKYPLYRTVQSWLSI